MPEVAIYFNYPLFSPVMNFQVLKTGKSSSTALHLKSIQCCTWLSKECDGIYSLTLLRYKLNKRY
jgi:hypothetical protein